MVLETRRQTIPPPAISNGTAIEGCSVSFSLNTLKENSSKPEKQGFCDIPEPNTQRETRVKKGSQVILSLFTFSCLEFPDEHNGHVS